MKRVIGVILSILFLAEHLLAQPVTDIVSLPLQVATHKTSNLIFPASVKSVDKGSRDILAQKARGLENVLHLKAARPSFQETNLTVITDDGKLYAFTLTYNENPDPLNLKVSATNRRFPEALFEKPSERELEETSTAVSGKPIFLTSRLDQKDGVRLQLGGIYVKDQVMYYQFQIQNNTALSYDLSQFRFVLRDRKQAKRTAIQEQVLPVLFALDKTERIPGGQSQQIIIALPKRTIPDKKILLVQLMEENGGRHLSIRLHNRHLIKARPIEMH